MQPGDLLLLAIGQGLLAATPLQLAVGYSTFANGGWVVHARTSCRRILEPETPDGEPGFADLTQAVVAVPDRPGQHPPDPDAARDPRPDPGRHPPQRHRARVQRPHARRPRSCSATTRPMRSRSPARRAPPRVATATRGTTRRRSPPTASQPEHPFTVVSYLEKAGFGSTGAAPVVKCMFLALSDKPAARPGRGLRDARHQPDRRRRRTCRDVDTAAWRASRRAGPAARRLARRWASRCCSASRTRGSATSARARPTRAGTSTGCC